MKRLLTAVCALAILAPGLASAQDRGRDRGRDGSDQYSSPTPGRGGRNGVGQRELPPPPPPPQAVQPAAPAPQVQPDRGPRGQQGDRGGQRDGQRDGQRGDGGGRGRDDRGPDFRGRDDRDQLDRRLGRGDRDGRPGFEGRPGLDGRPGFNERPGFDDRGRGFDGRQPDPRFNQRGPDNRRFDNGRRFDNNRGDRFRYGDRDFFRFRAQPYVWPRGFGSQRWRPQQILPRYYFVDRYYIDNFWDLGLPPPPYGYRWIRVGDDALLVDLRSGLIADMIPGVFFW